MTETLAPTRRFFAFLMSRARRQFLWSMALSAVVSLTEGIGVLLLLPMLKVAGIETRTAAVEGITRVVERGFTWIGVQPTVEAVLLLFLLTMTAHEAVGRCRRIANTRLHARVATTLRSTLFESLARTRWAFFSRERQAIFTRGLTLDVERTVTATVSMHSAAVAFSVGLLYLLLAFYVSPQVTLLVASTGVVIYLMMARYLQRSTEIGVRTGHRIDRLYTLTGEYLSAMKVVKSYDRVEDCIERFGIATSELSAANAEDGIHQAKMEMYYKTGAAVGLCVIVYAAVRVFALATADLLFLLVLFARVMPKLASTTRDLFVFASHVTSFDAIERLLARCSDNVDPHSGGRGTAAPASLATGISVEGVSFAYDTARPVLKDVSLEIPAGSVVALVGASGAGKTTLLDLVLGLLAPDRGHVRVDDEPMTPDSARSLRAVVGYVGQDTFLFNSSVRENLLWAAPEADDAEVRSALEMACAEFVHDLERGLDTPVGDRGALLSGGQRQRLSLARALLRKPRLLILDEATSALDRESEAHIMATVRELRGRMTVLVVSHRASAVREADRVYVLDEGKIVASGTWSEVRAEAVRRTAT